MYVPLPAHGPYSTFISQESIEALKPGETTRADVLLQIGDPAYTREDERFLVYNWRYTQGLFVVAVAPGAGGGRDVEATHVVCLEFGPDNRLVQVKEFQSGLLGDLVEDDPHKAMFEWIRSRIGSASGDPRTSQEALHP